MGKTKVHFKFLGLLLLTSSISCTASSFSKPPREPASQPPSDVGAVSPTPVPVTPPVAETPAVPEAPNADLPVSPKTDFLDIASEVGGQVDQYYSSHRELLVSRGPTAVHKVDSCQQELDQHTRFADRIAFFVEAQMQSQRPRIQSITGYFGTSSDVDRHEPVSLIRHPMCQVSSSSLTATLGSSRVPNASTIGKMNEFVARYNQYRREYLAGDETGKIKAQKLWTKLYSCLSYNESMTTADTNRSQAVSDKYAPSDYRRPAGVLFYEDPYQDAASRLNIGMFQFTPDVYGNVQSCVRSWNQNYPSCAVNEKASQAEMIRVLGSGYQTFNAFCAINKSLQTFAIQVNTTKSTATHPTNSTGSGLKAPGDRCVSLHFASGKAYNHFGPFQNSGGDTLNSLFTCALKN